MAKYGTITSSTKRFHEGEPIFLIRSTDPYAVTAIQQYAGLCQERGVPLEFCKEISKFSDEVAKWQRENPALVKDKPD